VHVAAVIGSPVGHSLSPAIHQAAFDANGLDWRYVAFDVPIGRADDALDAMRALGIAGLSVTTPHKEQVAACVDHLAPAAAALRSVNTVTLERGVLFGDSTDGDGFVAALAADGVEVAGLRVAVLGAGGAARSVVASLAAAGAAVITVVNRTAARAAEVAALAPGVAAVAGIAGAEAELAAAGLIVNATSVGFGTDELPLDASVLHPEHLVADLVYHPLDTALLRAAAAAGARTFDGLGMLVHQAALQQQRWVGALPDVAVMRAAAEAELARRG
jgi:shikimate dehydrogenase